MKRGVLIAFIVLTVSLKFLSATDYYVNATGGDDANDGLTLDTAWQTMTNVNGTAFEPGDNIYFARGEIWREQLTVPSSGNATDYITFGAYGSGEKPIISGGDLDDRVTGWGGPDANGEYNKTYAIEPRVVIGDNVTLTKGTVGSLVTTEWNYSGGKLYLGQDPATYSTLEVGQRSSVIEINSLNYISINNLTIEGSNTNGNIYIHNDSTYIRVQNCTLRRAFGYGLLARGSDYLTIDSNTAEDINSQDVGTSGDGFFFRVDEDENDDSCKYSTISNNICLNNIDRDTIGGTGIDDSIFINNVVSEIDFEPNANQSTSRNIICNNTASRVIFSISGNGQVCEGNTICNNTLVNDENINVILVSRGNGTTEIYGNNIIQNDDDSAIKITDNNKGGTYNIYNNDVTALKNGIGLDGGGTVNIYYNFLKATSGSAFGDFGIRTYTDAGTNLNVYSNIINGYYYGFILNNANTRAIIYDNTITNYGDEGVYLYDVALEFTSNNTIFYADDKVHLRKRSNAVYYGDYNLFHTNGTHWRWEGGGDETFQLWKERSSQDSNSFVADPLFANTSGYMNISTDFQLSWNSPAIDAGTDVGLSTDYAGNPIYGNPDIGAYEYQPPYNITNSTINTSISKTIRIYGDGKYRHINSTTASVNANLTIEPVNGFNSTNYSEWLNVNITSWNTTGSYHKNWTEEGSLNATVTHTIADLPANSYFSIKLDTVTGAHISGTSCTNGRCFSDGGGTIVFNYTGGYSLHSFEVTDITSPSLTFSCSPTSVALGTPVYCTCSGTDSGAGFNSSSLSYDSAPGVSNTGTFYITCSGRDNAGNSASATTSYTVISQVQEANAGGGGSASSSSSGSSSNYVKARITVNEEQFSQGYTREVGTNDKLEVKVNKRSHSIGVTGLTVNKATMIIESDPVYVVLLVGQETKVDIDKDNYYDLYLKLHAIENNKANLTIQNINESITESASITGDIIEEENIEIEDEQNTDYKLNILNLVKEKSISALLLAKNNKMLLIVGGLVLIFIIAGIVRMKRM